MINAIETFLVFLFSISRLSVGNGVYQSLSTSSVHNAIMVSGGWYWNSKLTNAVDVFIPSTGEVCSFTPLPYMMTDHTQQGLMICGGVADCPHCNYQEPCPPNGCDIDPGRVCYTFSADWTVSHQLAEHRRGALSWKSTAGVVLFYGTNDLTMSTELVKDDGTTELLYSMKYDVYGGCLIPDDDTGSVVITGGNEDEIVTARVTRYDLQGFIEDLPQLNIARSSHGCASYVSDGEGIFLMSGGRTASGSLTDSTELFIHGSWQESGRMPYAVRGLVGSTLDNNVYMLGGSGCPWPSGNCNFILKFDDSSKLWEWDYNMTTTREMGHSVTTVNLEEIGFDCST